MKAVSLFFLSFLLTTAFSCKQRLVPEAPQNLFEKYRKSVVLIKNKYYYQVELSNGLKAYFTELEDGVVSDLTFNEEEAIGKANVSYGTGFFISNDGKIATNKHVVAPIINDAQILTSLKIKFDDAKYKIKDYQQELTTKINDIDNYINTYYSETDFMTLQEMSARKDTLQNERRNLSIYGLLFDFEPSKSNITSKSVSLGLAFENTYVTEDNDYQKCVVYKVSDDKDVDLAVIQLKDKTTPANIKSVFDFSDHNLNIGNGTMNQGEGYGVDSVLKINTPVYMIGFNYGFVVGNTSEGLKAQLTQGTVSQEADNTKVLYSIPSLQGSSGSPIIDQWGNLVAINFAKISNTQSFNYGITVKHLKKLLEQ